jgi:uncharacterized protein YqhQ
VGKRVGGGGKESKCRRFFQPMAFLMTFVDCYVVDFLLSLQSVSCFTIRSILFFSFISHISIMSSTQVQASVLHGAKDLRIVSYEHPTTLGLESTTKDLTESNI